MTEKIKKRFGDNLSGYRFCIWGLSFKPGTDDMREASSLVLIQDRIKAGALTTIYDPVAIGQAEKELLKEWFADRKIIITMIPSREKH